MILVAALAGAAWLAPAPLAGQPPPAASSCPDDDPAKFHPCALARAKTFTPARTPDGKPDLQGHWRHRTPAHEDLEEHPKTVDDSGGPSAIVDPPDGKVPIQAWAETQRQYNEEKYIDQNILCYMSGVPRHLYMGAYQILQTPDHVLLLSEEAHAYRIVTLGARPHIGKKILLWQGDSRGRWEGNTLVIDTTNQNGRPWLDQRGRFYTEAAHVVERLTLIDANTIHYQATVDDPLVYTRPFTIAFPLRRNSQPGFELWEESCHEGESNSQHLRNLGYGIYPGISANEAKAAAARARGSRPEERQIR
jgi:hypothetical protein